LYRSELGLKKLKADTSNYITTTIKNTEQLETTAEVWEQSCQHLYSFLCFIRETKLKNKGALNHLIRNFCFMGLLEIMIQNAAHK